MARQVIRDFIRRPQRVFLRKAMFQIHLWVGLLLAIYAVLIGLSGSILVLRQEFQEWTGLNPQFGAIEASGAKLGFAGAEAVLRARFPKAKLGLMYPPRKENPAYYAFLANGRERLSVSVHPYTGAILEAKAPQTNWLTWVGQLHYFLLLPRTPGFQINGILSALLVLMAVTGIVIWWPGIRQWVRGFVVDFRKNWKRVNFDLHNVVGFWTVSIVTIWAISGVYLVWPQPFTAAVNAISPVHIEGARENRVRASENKSGLVTGLGAIEAEAATLLPGSHIGAIAFPSSKTAPLMLYMVKDGKESLSGADFLYFDSATGAHLKTSLRNNPQTAGDWVIWLMRPLHFGTHWGLAVKILWFVLGLSLPLLGVTGALMYWNRYLSKKWRALRARGTVVHGGEFPAGREASTLVYERTTEERSEVS